MGLSTQMLNICFIYYILWYYKFSSVYGIISHCEFCFLLHCGYLNCDGAFYVYNLAYNCNFCLLFYHGYFTTIPQTGKRLGCPALCLLCKGTSPGFSSYPRAQAWPSRLQCLVIPPISINLVDGGVTRLGLSIV